MELKRRSARSITHTTVGAKHSEIMKLSGQFDEVLERFAKQQESEALNIRVLSSSIEAKKNFLHFVRPELTKESIAAANAVLEQANAMLEIKKSELETTNARAQETKAYAKRVKSVLANIEVERFRENSQRSINATNSKNVGSLEIKAPATLDSETSLEKDIRLLTHQITAFIEISGK